MNASGMCGEDCSTAAGSINVVRWVVGSALDIELTAAENHITVKRSLGCHYVGFVIHSVVICVEWFLGGRSVM